MVQWFKLAIGREECERIEKEKNVLRLLELLIDLIADMSDHCFYGEVGYMWRKLSILVDL